MIVEWKYEELFSNIASLRIVASSAFSLLLGTVLILAMLSSAWAQSDHEQEVKDLVDRFLLTVGDGDFDALPAMFASKANIGTASLRDGNWVASTMTFEDWLNELRAEKSWARFREPVTGFTVHVENGQMAFVRADATVVVNDQVRSHNIDYFTLVRDDNSWKFLSASYVAKPVPSD